MSTFKSSAFDDNVKVHISSADGASELAVVNGAYNLIGHGIGALELDLPPGTYQVRQSIGTTMTVRDIDVPSLWDGPTVDPITVNLEPIRFSTPAPIAGTTTFRDVPGDMWQKPAELVGRPGLRLVLRAPLDDTADEDPSPATLAHVEAELRRMRLETLAGATVFDFANVTLPDRFPSTALIVEDLALEAGHYVLVQASDGEDGNRLGHHRQRCLPVIVHRDFAPRIYLLSLIDEATGRPLGVNLDNASVIYWPNTLATSPSSTELTLVEAARKALSKGQRMGGYIAARRYVVTEGAQSPMLALMDAYLLLCGRERNWRAGAAEAIQAAAAELGEGFPDVIALRCAYRALAQDTVPVNDTPSEPDALSMPPNTYLSGPPMLAISWGHLLATEAFNTQLSRIMPCSFQPELGGTWMTWNEPVGTRVPDATEANSASRSTGEGASTAKAQLVQTAAAALVKLMRQKIFNDAVTRMRALVAQQDDMPADERLDPLVIDLIHGLGRMQDQFLIRAFGAEQVATEVLTSLRIPSDRYADLLASVQNLVRTSDSLDSFLAHLGNEVLSKLKLAMRLFRG